MLSHKLSTVTMKHFCPQRALPELLVDYVVIRGVLHKIAPFNLRDIPNECLIACLQYLMENNPVRFSILN